MNTSILTDETYIKEIKNIFSKVLIDYESIIDKRTLWDLFKIKAKEFSIRFSQNNAKKKRVNLNEIDKNIEDIHHNNILTDFEKSEQIKYLKGKLNTYLAENAKAAQIRSRAKYIEEGERSTSYFLNLEKTRQMNNSIFKLKQEDQTITDIDEILHTTTNFYKSLYTSSNPDKTLLHEYIQNIPCDKKLNNDDKLLCEGDITIEECEYAVFKNLQPNKSPGLDGIPNEFYQVFWPTIKNFVIEVFNEIYEKGQLSNTQRKAVLSLIFKGGDRELLKNYRPISLTNSDYKIISFILSNRVHKVLHKIISADQTGYIKKRFIGCNIRLVEDIIEYSKKYYNKGAILFLDFKKAFDSLEWDFMLKALEKFNFGPDFLKWVKIFYTDPEAVIKVNGFLSSPVKLYRGVRQGCPLAALLFIIAVELLSIQIKNNQELSGFELKQKNKTKIVKISQYADDSMLFLKNLEQIYLAIEILTEFGKFAGLVLNVDKTQALYLGTMINQQNQFGGIKLTTDPIRCLGVYVGHDQEGNEDKNWKEKFKKIENLIDSWQKRTLTYFGKITILKALIISQFVHVVINTHTPDWVIHKLTNTCFRFIWNGPDKIKRDIAYLNTNQGGLSMINIKLHFLALKATWISRIFENKDANWAFIPYHLLLNECLDKTITGISLKMLKHLSFFPIFPPFYKQVLTGYISANKFNHSDVTNIPLWGNELILNSKSKPLYFKNWINSGILSVKDIKVENHKINETYLYNKLMKKCNSLSELYQVKTAVRKYIPQLENLGNTVPIFNNNVIVHSSKSKPFYKNMHREPVVLKEEQTWHILTNSIYPNFDFVYLNKIINIRDLKIAEFNFKLFHQILPCRIFLCKIGVLPYNTCAWCDKEESIEHMLFTCSSIKNIWIIISEMLQLKLTYENLVLTTKSIEIDWLISLVEYLIFKRWVLNQNGQKVLYLKKFLKMELKSRYVIYNMNSYTDICNCISKLVNILYE